MAALDGELTPAQMTPERFTDREVIALAQKITFSVDETLQNRYPVSTLARLTIETRSGQSLTARADKLKGDWNCPMTDEEIKDKFRRFAHTVLPCDTIEKRIGTVWELEFMEKPWQLLNV